MKLDILIFAAHPDDAELSMGGTIAKLSYDNYKIGVVDLTLAEMSTRGTKKIRLAEADTASAILKLKVRENLKLPDGNIKIDINNIRKVVSIIRKYKPEIIFAPYFNDRHPDHINTSILVKDAMFKSGLSKFKTKIINTDQAAFRPQKLFYYMQTYAFNPSFVVDISKTFETKMKSVKAYKSQFFNPASKEADTFISSKNFLDFIEARAKYFGFSIGANYGEPFYSEENFAFDFLPYLSDKS